jgi:catechol 2,3-dioxygenase-like lactoylglutathione lyase family enzyme
MIMADEHRVARPAALETIIIHTERIEPLARFYREGLALPPFEVGDRHIGQQLGDIYFGFDQTDLWPGTAPSAVTLWFTVDDLQAAFERFVRLGAEVRYPPTRTPWGGHLAAVYDPDGNIVGLAQRQS